MLWQSWYGHSNQEPLNSKLLPEAPHGEAWSPYNTLQLTVSENFGDLSITPWKQLIPDRSFVKEFLPSKGKVITGSNGRVRKKKSPTTGLGLQKKQEVPCPGSFLEGNLMTFMVFIPKKMLKLNK